MCIALDERAKYGYKPVGWDSWGYPNASRYVRKFQSRRSLLYWKIYHERLDFSGRLAALFEEVDLLLMPTMPVPVEGS